MSHDRPYEKPVDSLPTMVREQDIESGFQRKLEALKYTLRPDIRDRAALEQNFRQKFEALNQVQLTDSEFARLLDEIVTPDVFKASQTLRERNAFTRDDGTPLNFTLVNIKDWCKNSFEVVTQLRINTDNSHHRYKDLGEIMAISPQLKVSNSRSLPFDPHSNSVEIDGIRTNAAVDLSP